jgi:hypothetical protein
VISQITTSLTSDDQKTSKFHSPKRQHDFVKRAKGNYAFFSSPGKGFDSLVDPLVLPDSPNQPISLHFLGSPSKMPPEYPDRPERPREDRGSPYRRPKDDRSDRARSPSSSPRDRDYRSRDRSPRRRSVSAERRRRSRSKTPPRDDRGRDRRSPRGEGRSRGSSRSRTPPRRRRTPSPLNGEGHRYRRDYDSPRGGYGHDSARGRGWMRGAPPFPGRGAYSYRPSGPPFPRGSDPNGNYSSRGPQHMQAPEFPQLNSSPSNLDINSSDSSSAPSGPASWRRAQQYRQDRPFHPDYRPPYPPSGPCRSAPYPRTSPRPLYHPTSQSPHPTSAETTSTSPPSNRIPTGPRSLNRPADPLGRREYVSPVPDLDEKVVNLIQFLIPAREIKSGTRKTGGER